MVGEMTRIRVEDPILGHNDLVFRFRYCSMLVKLVPSMRRMSEICFLRIIYPSFNFALPYVDFNPETKKIMTPAQTSGEEYTLSHLPPSVHRRLPQHSTDTQGPLTKLVSGEWGSWPTGTPPSVASSSGCILLSVNTHSRS